MMDTYLGSDADGLDGFEFLTMAEAGEVGHLLFSGDSLAWDPPRQRLMAFRRACWYSWDAQTESLARFAASGLTFDRLLCGHGWSHDAPTDWIFTWPEALRHYLINDGDAGRTLAIDAFIEITAAYDRNTGSSEEIGVHTRAVHQECILARRRLETVHVDAGVAAEGRPAARRGHPHQRGAQRQQRHPHHPRGGEQHRPVEGGGAVRHA